MNVLGKQAAPQPAGQEKEEQAGPEDKDKAPAGAPHVLIVRAPGGLLTWLTAIASRRKAEAGGGIPAAFTGTLITGGYTGYQHLLPGWPASSSAAPTSSAAAAPWRAPAPAASSPGPAT